MRRKQVTAILLSAIMTVSVCMPVNGIAAFAAENAGAGSTEVVSVAEEQNEDSSFAAVSETETTAVSETETTAASETETSVAGKTDATAAVETETAETGDAEGDPSVSGEEAPDAQEAAEQKEHETESGEQGKIAFETSDETASEGAYGTAADDVDGTVSVVDDQTADTAAEMAEDSPAQVIEEEAKEETDKAALKSKEPEPSDFEDAEEIFPGDSKTVDFDAGYNGEDFPGSIWKFTPDESGLYRFYAITDGDGFELSPVTYDSSYKRLSYYGYIGDGYAFALEHYFHEGTTYYLTANVYYYHGGSGFTVYLEQMELPDFYVEEEDDLNDIYVPYGEEVTLSLFAYSSTGELYYEWRDNGTEEILGTSDSYTFKAERNRSIALTVTDSTDEEIANRADKSFGIHIINHLTVNPEGVERDGDTAKVYTLGEPVTLRTVISADDESQLSIMWMGYVDTINEWEEIEKDLVTIEGANSSELVVEDVKNGDEYYCFVSDQYGNRGEAWFCIYVRNLISAYPEGAANDKQDTAYITADAGSPLTLRPVVKALDESQLEYEWSRQNEDGEYVEIEGANSAEYRMDQAEQGKFECRITDLFGEYQLVYFSVEVDNQLKAYPEGESENSRYAQLTVSPLSSPVLHVLVKAIDESRITYKWQKIIDYGDYEDIEGANGAEYQPILGRDNSYRCVVSDQYGNSEEVEFYLYVDNKLSVHPEGEYDGRNHANVYTDYGESATLRVNVQAIDDSHLTYKWYGDGETVYETDGPELVVQNVTKTQSYRCVVDDSYGYGRDCYFTINIENHLNVYAEGYGKRTDVLIKVSPHAPLALKVVAEADDTSQMTYKWVASDYQPVDGDTDTYTIPSVEFGGVYYCTVTDRYENSETVYFTVKVDNQFVCYPEGAEEGEESVDLYVGYGQPVTLRAVTSALEEDKITYEWRDRYWDYLSDVDGNEVTIDSVTEPMTYTCEVNDGFGNYEYLYFYIHIENHLTAYPEGYEGHDTAYLYVKPGTEVTMHTVAGADDKKGLRYYWYREDAWEDIDPNDGDTLTVDAKDAEYVCVVSDKYGNYKRVMFVLRVENGFTAYPEGAAMDENGQYEYFVNLYPKAGEKLDLNVIASSDQGALSYKWYENAIYETSWGEYETDYEPMAEAGNTAAIQVTAEKNTSYCCTVSDEYGNEQDVEFYIHMGGAGFVAYPEGNEDTQNNRIAITAEQGKEMTLRVLTEGEEDAEYTYKWSEGPLNDSGWWPLEEGVDGTKDSLTVTPESSRRYLCVVTDQYDNQAMAYFYVNVNGMTVTTNQGTPYLTGDNRYEIHMWATAGESVTLKTTVETEQAAELLYSWKYCEPRYGAEELPGEYGDSITVKAGDSKYYVHSIEDGTGNRVTVWYYLDIDNQLAVYPQEGAENTTSVDIVTKVGEKLTLKPVVSAADMTKMEYEWSDSNGRSLGEDADLVLSVAREDVITCRVTDRFGTMREVTYIILFKERPSIVDISQADITIGDVTYNGKAQLPRIGIYGGGRTLVEGTDYTVTCGQNINAGTYQITISGIGNLTGSVDREYKILKAEQKITAGDITLRPYETAKLAVTGAMGELSYTSGVASVATVAADGTVTAVKAGTASITVSAAETDNYKAATAQPEVTVNAYDLSSSECKVTLAQTTAVYSGKEIKPAATVKFGDLTLTEGTDYTVSYQNNVNAGSAALTITGNGKTAANSATAAFTITKAPQEISSDAPADGLKIKIGESAKITVSGAQGDVAFAVADPAIATVAASGAAGTVSAVKEGSTKITVNAAETDNYEAAKALEIVVKVVPATIDLSELEITVDDSGLVYDGKAKTPKVTVKHDGAVLTEGFTVSYQNNVDAGLKTAKAIVTGDNVTLSGTKEVEFTILPGKTTRGDMFNLANNVKVTWQAVPGAKYYKVYRTGVTSASESRKEPVIVTAGLVGWDKDPGLENGHAYRYTIVASLTGKGDASGDSPKSYSKLMYRLKTVVIRSVKNTAPGKVTVKYDKTTSGDSYVLQYCERQDMVGAKTKVVLGANNTSYVIGGLKKGKTYYISIRVRKKVNGIDYYTTFGVPKKVTITK